MALHKSVFLEFLIYPAIDSDLPCLAVIHHGGSQEKFL